MNNDINVNVSYGEFIDKLTILEVKLKLVTNSKKLKNVKTEYDILNAKLEEQKDFFAVIETEKRKLFVLNLTLWKIEDRLRELETLKKFNEEFIDLARCVYLYNDKRNFLKNRINTKLKCSYIEVKSFTSKEVKNEVENLLIIPNMGTGDILLSSPIIRFYDFDHNVVLIVPRKVEQMVRNLFVDTTVQFEFINTNNLTNFRQEEIQVQFIIKKYFDKNYGMLPLGCYKNLFTNMIIDNNKFPFYKIFYFNSGLPSSIFKMGFYYDRDENKEDEVYNSFLLKYGLKESDNYIIINDDSSRNFNIDKTLIKSELPTIYLDSKKCDLFFDNIFNYLKLISNSKEFHSFDTAFSWLVELTDITSNKFMHSYLKDIAKFDFFGDKWGWKRIDK